MANRRKTHLDALERQLTGPKRIALFGHRNVGKTTLLAMFYRQASTGQGAGPPPGGGRRPDRRVSRREDRADRVGRVARGDPGRDRAEAPALPRPGAVRPDRQGLPGRARHARLRRADPGSSSPIATPSCSASTPTARPDPADRRRRQQEVENLLERYIDRSDDATTGRPIALLLTKFDRVLAQQQAATAEGEGEGPTSPTTRRLGRREAGRGAVRDDPARAGRSTRPGARSSRSARTATSPRTAAPPPTCTRSACKGRSSGSPSSSRRATATSSTGSGTSPPTTSLACRAASPPSIGAIPRSDRTAEYRARLKALRRRRMRRIGLRLATAAVADRRGPGRLRRLGGPRGPRLRARQRRPRRGQALGEGRWPGTRRSRSSGPIAPGWPASKLAEWTVKAAEVQVANGTAGPDLRARAGRPQGQGPAPRPGDPQGRGRAGPGAARRALERGEVGSVRPGRRAREAAGRGPAVPPRLPRVAPPRRGPRAAQDLRGPGGLPPGRRSSGGPSTTSIRSEGLPDADFRDLIDRAQQFLAEHPAEPVAGRGRAPDRRLRQEARRRGHRPGPAVLASNTRPTSRRGSSGIRTT